MKNKGLCMISESSHNGDVPTKKADPYENLKQFYFHEINGQKLLMNIANDFKSSNAFMVFDGGVMWSVAYLGTVLEFLNNTIQSIQASPHLSTSMAKWLDGELPVNVNPQIEIGPDKIVDYAMQVVRKYPTKEYEKYIEELGTFKILYDNSEIMQKLRKKTAKPTSS